MPHPTSSRRSVLAALAATSVVATPAASRLRPPQMQAFYATYLEAWAEYQAWRRRTDERHATCALVMQPAPEAIRVREKGPFIKEEQTRDGVCLWGMPLYWTYRGDEDRAQIAAAYLQERDAIAARFGLGEALDNELDLVSGRIHEAEDAILKAVPTSWADLRIQALVLNDTIRVDTIRDDAVASFVENVLRLTATA